MKRLKGPSGDREGMPLAGRVGGKSLASLVGRRVEGGYERSRIISRYASTYFSQVDRA